MAAIVMKALAGSWLVTEANLWRARDERSVTIPEGGLVSGQLLKVNGDNLEAVTAAVDEAVAILLFDAERDEEAVAQNKELTVIARDAEVFGPGLTFFDGATDAEMATMGDALTASAGLTVRWK